MVEPDCRELHPFLGVSLRLVRLLLDLLVVLQHEVVMDITNVIGYSHNTVKCLGSTFLAMRTAGYNTTSGADVVGD